MPRRPPQQRTVRTVSFKAAQAAAGATRVAVCHAGAAAASAVAVAACTWAVPTGAAADDLVLLQVTPAGEFGPNDGRDAGPWRIDAASAQAVIERFAARGNPPPVIDYEHQTLHKEQNGAPAPAAGWMHALRWIEGRGLFAQAELTERARQHIAAGEYRYFSPVFEYDQDSGQVLAVHMGALTNTPGISGMQPLALVAAASKAFLPSPIPPAQEPSVNPLLKALLAALGLPETTTEEAALAALTALGPLAQLKERAGVATAACTALQLEPGASADAVTAAATQLRRAPADPAKFVPVEAVAQLQGQIAALTARQQEADVAALIAPALADGRLPTAMEAWARDLGKKDVAALTAYLDAAQPIAALTQTQTGGKPPAATGAAQLSSEELAVASRCGLSAEAFATGRT